VDLDGMGCAGELQQEQRQNDGAPAVAGAGPAMSVTVRHAVLSLSRFLRQSDRTIGGT
jgi:hypothetical protein